MSVLFSVFQDFSLFKNKVMTVLISDFGSEDLRMVRYGSHLSHLNRPICCQTSDVRRLTSGLSHEEYWHIILKMR